MTCTPTPASSAAASARCTAPTASPAPHACSSPPSEQLGLLALESPPSTHCERLSGSMDETSLSECASRPSASVDDACVVEFTVPGAPVPKGRARSRIVKTRDGRQFVSHYTPDETTQYENLIRMCAKDAMHDRYPLDGPLRLEVTIVIPIPSSWSGRKQRDAAAGVVGATKKPDVDNFVKALADGCNGVAWVDDAQVVELVARKRYGAMPRVEVRAEILAMERA